MANIDRPNKQALIDALDIYRDEMRAFIVWCLKRVRGRKIEDCIKSALRDDQYNQFQQNRHAELSIESSIDIGDFPQIVQAHWRDVFGNAFNTEGNVQDDMYEIIEARNKVSHPDTQDIELDYAENCLKKSPKYSQRLTNLNRAKL